MIVKRPFRTQVAMARLLNTEHVQMVHVPYKDGGINGVMSGVSNISFEASPSGIPQIQGARLRALAVSASKRLEQLADAPAVGETIPGFSADSWHKFLAEDGAAWSKVVRDNTILGD